LIHFYKRQFIMAGDEPDSKETNIMS